MITKMMHQILITERSCLKIWLNSQKKKGQKKMRKKVFQTHLLSSPENQEIIKNADKVSKRKEDLTKAKNEAYKRFLEKKKQKRKNSLERKRLLLGLSKYKQEVCQHQ